MLDNLYKSEYNINKTTRGSIMKKSVYSVVLADDVIAKVDKLAYLNSTNRSNMINQILAEYVSLVTPEKRISSIFDELARQLYAGETFSELSPPTSSVMSVRTALSYKYNPTVKYSIELYREPEHTQGVIKVSTRTTNPALLSKMLEFYNAWAELEYAYGFTGKDTFENGVFKRPIIYRENGLAGKGAKRGLSAGELIADYVYLFDSAMKMYFSDSIDEIRPAYEDYIRQNSEII